jgi:competence protein ComEC
MRGEVTRDGVSEDEMRSSYDEGRLRSGLRRVPGLVITIWVCMAVTTALFASVALSMILLGAAALLLLGDVRPEPGEQRNSALMLWSLLITIVIAVVTLARVGGEEPQAPIGLHQGWAQVVSEPRPQQRGVRVILRIDGQRVETFVTDPQHLAEVSKWQGGHQVFLLGEYRPLTTQRASRVAWQHVRAAYRIDAIRERSEGSRISELSNRFRSSISRGAEVLPATDAALFQGLVIGDRSGQTPEMQQRYAASGLSHLTVVSGLNVSLLLMAVSPLIRRTRPMLRWMTTLVLLAWFVSLTRYEPSILRAATMAALVATATLRGEDRGAWRVLWLAVGGLVLYDPAMVHSVGFWLSVGATAGVAVLGPRLAVGLGVLGPFARPLGISLGAQIGVAPPMLLLMGGIPLWSVPANLLAVPVASVIKLYGLPAAAIAGAAPALAEPLMFPTRVGVRWVDLVARVAASIETGPLMSAGIWVIWFALSGGALATWALGSVKEAGWVSAPSPDKNRGRHDHTSAQG